MEVHFFMSIFPSYPGLKMSFEHKSAQRNLIFCACFSWDSRFSLLEMDQKFKFGGTNVYGDSFLEFFLRHFKVSRLHARLHAAAGAVQAHSGKGPGNCSMIRRGPNSCLLGHATGLLFCLHIKHFLSSIFNSVNF